RVLFRSGLELRDRVPVARNEQQHRELVAEGAHAAVDDVAGAIEHDARQVIDESGSVATERGNDDELHQESLTRISTCSRRLANNYAAAGRLESVDAAGRQARAGFPACSALFRPSAAVYRVCTRRTILRLLAPRATQ